MWLIVKLRNKLLDKHLLELHVLQCKMSVVIILMTAKTQFVLIVKLMYDPWGGLTKISASE